MQRAFCFLALVVAATVCSASERSLVTIAEESRFQRTGRYEEVQRLCPAFQRARPEAVRCIEFDRTPEGRPMLALVASADGVLDPAAAREQQRPVVFMQGGIHAGEVDGKEAGFLVLREILEGKAGKDVLRHVTFVFVPVFNVDGHERFGRWNRPNQNGPEEMGWRTTAQNLNLNRDYTKADAPEMQAMLRLMGEWDPILFADLHATDGAKFEHDIALLVAPTLAGDTELTRAGRELRDALLERVAAQGSLPLSFYPSFVVADDPASGFADNVAPARFSHAYWALRNRLGVLVETHSWKDYPTRVRITRNSILAMLELAAEDGQRWLRLARAADARTADLVGTPVALTYANTDEVTMLDFRGYEYTREPSAVSGGLVTRYDDTKPQVWRIPLKQAVEPEIVVNAPRGGYIVPAAHAHWVGEKLALHGIEAHEFDKALATAVEVFRAEDATMAASAFEGRSPLTLEGEWRTEQRDVPPGSLYVPLAQPRGRLAMTLLEPRDPDSLASWGFFNAAFERKEYMEAYVAEEVGRDMLDRDPQVREEFERRLASDPSFASSPAARLEFFYRRHPSWDERYNLYPVYRIDRNAANP